MTVAVNWRIDPKNFRSILNEIGEDLDDIEDQRLIPALNGQIKRASALFTAEEQIVKRGDLTTKAHEYLSEVMVTNNVFITNVEIKNIKFEDDFAKSIELKEIERQQALAASYKEEKERYLENARVAKEKGVGDAAKARAEGQKKANDILFKSLAPEIIKMKYLEKWNGKLPTVLGSKDNGILLNIYRTN